MTRKNTLDKIALTVSILNCLAVCGPLTVADLAKKLSARRERIRRIIFAMQPDGLIEAKEGERTAIHGRRPNVYSYVPTSARKKA